MVPCGLNLRKKSKDQRCSFPCVSETLPINGYPEVPAEGSVCIDMRSQRKRHTPFFLIASCITFEQLNHLSRPPGPLVLRSPGVLAITCCPVGICVSANVAGLPSPQPASTWFHNILPGPPAHQALLVLGAYSARLSLPPAPAPTQLLGSARSCHLLQPPVPSIDSWEPWVLFHAPTNPPTQH